MSTRDEASSFDKLRMRTKIRMRTNKEPHPELVEG
jgi:hypothetical protein